MHREPARSILVIIVDDDESVRESLPHLVRELGYDAREFASADAFLASGCIPETRCLILDIALPGMSGPALQRELIRRGHSIPVIFITALGKESLPPGLLQHGTIDVLFKPFSEQDLSAALAAAFARD